MVTKTKLRIYYKEIEFYTCLDLKFYCKTKREHWKKFNCIKSKVFFFLKCQIHQNSND